MTNSRGGTEFPTIDSVSSQVYVVPTDQPEADGTIAWSSTTVVVARIVAGDWEGMGWTYAGEGAATTISETLAGLVKGARASDTARLHESMLRACRNLGLPGVAACAVSALDIALWDLKARIVGVPLADLFGLARDEAPIYGSGGFTNYDDATTLEQLERWTSEWRIPRVKIKIGESWGSEPDRDLERVALSRRAIGNDVELYVDANGGYSVKQAIRMGRALTDQFGVTWFEEPVSSDNLAGLRRVRAMCDADIAAGEYGYTLPYFAHMLMAGSVDCLQADATRCGGYTSWLKVAALAHAHNMQISAHCAPNLHAHVATAVPNLRHIEYFHDHHRIETSLFTGVLSPSGGALRHDPERSGHGLTVNPDNAEQYRDPDAG
ncbi:MAG TPA: enolase C-terminal domain-like protein [Acidimicrobiales bacterium]|nr:enolase C-terminal domain-like protein [Acidimicrobiales bacterium]